MVSFYITFEKEISYIPKNIFYNVIFIWGEIYKIAGIKDMYFLKNIPQGGKMQGFDFLEACFIYDTVFMNRIRNTRLFGL